MHHLTNVSTSFKTTKLVIFQARKALKTEKEAHEFAIDNLTEDNGELHALVSELQGKKEGLEAEAAESAAQRSAFKAQLDALEAKREEAKAGRVDTASPSRSDALLQVRTLVRSLVTYLVSIVSINRFAQFGEKKSISFFSLGK